MTVRIVVVYNTRKYEVDIEDGHDFPPRVWPHGPHAQPPDPRSLVEGYLSGLLMGQELAETDPPLEVVAMTRERRKKQAQEKARKMVDEAIRTGRATSP